VIELNLSDETVDNKIYNIGIDNSNLQYNQLSMRIYYIDEEIIIVSSITKNKYLCYFRCVWILFLLYNLNPIFIIIYQHYKYVALYLNSINSLHSILKFISFTFMYHSDFLQKTSLY